MGTLGWFAQADFEWHALLLFWRTELQVMAGLVAVVGIGWLLWQAADARFFHR